MIGEEIARLTETLAPELVAMRRDFHRYAERGWLEVRTAAIIARTLETDGCRVRLGAEVLRPEARLGVPSPAELDEHYARALAQGAPEDVARRLRGGLTGVVAELDTGRPGPVVGVRVDIDANDGHEATSPSHRPAREGFASVNAGAHHNCGHDGHAAIAVTVARILAAVRDGLRGRCKFFFQPAEEGTRGARAMVESGVVDDVERLLCLHIGVRALATSQVVAGTRDFLATTKIDARFRGVAAHAGIVPEQGRNALAAAATAVLNLLALPRHSGGESRINVGSLHAGEGRNIVPAEAVLRLETRGTTNEVDAYLSDYARRILEHAARMHGVECEVTVAGQTITAASDPEVVTAVERAARAVKAVTRVDGLAPFGASDDATYFMDRVQRRGGQASYVVFGSALAGGHHTPEFDFDEATLPIAVEVTARTLAGWLGGE